MSSYTSCKVFKVINNLSDSELDYESLKNILNKRQIRSEIAEHEDGWLIKIDQHSTEILAKNKYRLLGEFNDQDYFLNFTESLLPFPEKCISSTETSTGNPESTVLVTNIPPNTKSGEILNFFETKGGQVRKICTEKDHVKINFCDEKAANRVVLGSPIPFKGSFLQIHKETSIIRGRPLKKHGAQVGTRTICVSNVPEEMDLENLALFFQNKGNGGGKMEKDPTRDPRTNLVEITFTEEETANRLAEKSTVTFNKCHLKISLKKPCTEDEAPKRRPKDITQRMNPSIILVEGVPKEMSIDEVLFYFKNPKRLKGGEIIDWEDFDRKRGIQIKFASPDTAKNVIDQYHKIGPNVLRVSMYVPSKVEEKQFLIYDIKDNVHEDSLETFLEVVTGINVVQLKNVKEGSWLVECDEKFDFEDMKTKCRDGTKKFISDTYPKVKQIEVTRKIIVTNIPENYNEESLKDYFSDAFNPEDLVSLKMLPGKRCIVTFNDHSIASRWSTLKRKKFDIDLYYDYIDGNETCNEIKLESNFLLDFIKKHKNVFEDELKGSGYPVWSESHGNLLKVISIKDTEKQEIEKKVKELLETIFKEELDISFDIFEEVQETFHKKESTVSVYFDSGNYKVHIFSFNKSAVVEYKNEILNIVESKSNHKVELEFPSHKISLLYSDLFPSKIFPHYKKLKVSKKDKKIELCGSTIDIEAVRVEVYKFLSEVSSTPVPLPHNAENILNKNKVKEYLKQKLKSQKIICSWEIKTDGQVVIYCSNDNKLNSAISVFKEIFLELNFNVTEAERKLMREEKWKIFLKELSLKYTDNYYIDEQRNEKISIVTTKEIAQNIGGEFEKFFATHVIYTSTLTMESGFYDYLKTFNQMVITKFCQDHSSTTIDFQNDQTINISASRDTHKKASDFLSSLKRNIIEIKEEFCYFGFKKFLQMDVADTILNKLEKSYECIIKKNKDINYKKFERKHVSDLQVKYASSFIILHNGNIMDLGVDAIVCPSNRELKHIGGLGKELCQKGGFSVQAECDDILNARLPKTFPEGSVEVTTAGMLNSKIIIHAVGPVWKGGRNYEYESLCEAVTNSLIVAEQNKCNSIAFPAISTGIFKFPIDKSTEATVSNIKDYLSMHPDSSLKSIYLVSIREDIFSSFQKQLIANFPGTLHLKEYNDADKHVKPQPVTPEPMMFSPKPMMVSQQANPSQTDIIIESGLLNKSQCDVIVNTTNSSLDLSSGAISKALLKDAGQELQTECFQHSISHYSVVVTNGYKLPCKKVFHISLPVWNKSSPDVIKIYVKNCLKKADEMNFQEIAFPAFGTGNLGYPVNIVANEMYNAASQYISDTQTNLQKICFVVHPNDTVIKTAFESIKSGERNLPSDRILSDIQPYQINDSVDAATNVPPQDIEGIDINGIKLTPLNGDILDQNVHAIVHGTNQHFTLNGAVSKALLKRIGYRFQSDCQSKIGEMLSQNYAITDASPLAASHILHINIEGIVKNPEQILKLCFDAAEKEKITSLALPPFGTGGLGCSVADITKSLLNALKNFSKSQTNHLRTVNFVIFHQQMFAEVCQLICPKENISTSLLPKFTSKLPSWIPGSANKDKNAGPFKSKNNPSPISLYFYATNSTSVKRAKEDLIFQYEKDYLICKDIENKNIPEFTRLEHAKIIQLQDQHEISIKIKSTMITVNGYKDDVLIVIGLIQNIILNFVNETKSEQAADLLQQIVQWGYMNSVDGKTVVEPYPKDINQQLEEAYKDKRILQITRNNNTIIFDVTKPDEMFEYEERNPQRTVKIVRNDKTQGVSLPEHWDLMGEQNYMKVELQPGDEYEKVKKIFPSNFTIIKIERVQNKTLYHQYQAQLDKMKAINPSGTVNETQELWHGTSEDVTEKINANGFDKNYCVQNVTEYGGGVYFAVNPLDSLKDDSSPPNNQGHKKVYSCNVLTGMFCQGNPDMRALPENPQLPGTPFNSAVDNEQTPTMYITFHDSAAYPVYLITCQ